MTNFVTNFVTNVVVTKISDSGSVYCSAPCVIHIQTSLLITRVFLQKIERALPKFLNKEDVKDGLDLNLELKQIFIGWPESSEEFIEKSVARGLESISPMASIGFTFQTHWSRTATMEPRMRRPRRTQQSCWPRRQSTRMQACPKFPSPWWRRRYTQPNGVWNMTKPLAWRSPNSRM